MSNSHVDGKHASAFSRRGAPEFCGSSPLETRGEAARRQARDGGWDAIRIAANRGACGRATAGFMARGPYFRAGTCAPQGHSGGISPAFRRPVQPFKAEPP